MITTDNGKYKNEDCLKLLCKLVHKRSELYKKRYDDPDNDAYQNGLINTYHDIGEILSYINTNYTANITDEIADVYGLELDNIRQVYIMHGQLVFEHENKRSTLKALPTSKDFLEYSTPNYAWKHPDWAKCREKLEQNTIKVYKVKTPTN